MTKIPPSLILVMTLAAVGRSLPQTQAEPPAPSVLAVDAETFEGKLVSWDSRGQLRFDLAGHTRDLPVEELVRWSAPLEADRGPLVYLADGSVLAGDVAILEENQLLLRTEPFGDVKLPANQVRGVVFAIPAASADRDRLDKRLLDHDGDNDRLLFRSGDELAVSFTSLKDDRVYFHAASDALDVEIKKLSAVFFKPLPAKTPVDRQARRIALPTHLASLRAFAGFQDGSLLHVDSLFLDRDSLQAVLRCGQKLTSNQPGLLCSLQPVGGEAVYLSDLEPHTVRHIPYLDLEWKYRRDRSVVDTRLRAGGQLYLKGLGVHSGARLTYRLDRQYSKFQTELAVDDQAKRGGSVTFRVLTTEGDRWTEIYASPTLRGGDRPLAISLNIEGAKAIALAVDYADRGDVLDYADWLGARLVR